MLADVAALGVVREHLDRVLYALVDHRIGLELQRSSTGFPRFAPLRRLVDRLDPAHRTLFRLFRLGEPVSETSFRAAFPPSIAEALCACGLVVPSEEGVRTPGLLVVPAQGLLLITGVPAGYPTASPGRRPHAVFDLSTSFVAAALPHSLAGLRVLDVCSGSGVQALLCAARGAEEVVGVELSSSAIAVATANAVLNGLSDRVRFRRSDLLSALGADVRFDFVVANLPYAPALPASVTSVAEIGTSLVWPLLEALPAHLTDTARGVVATWRAAGSDQLQEIARRLAPHGIAVTASVDPLHETVDGVMASLAAETSDTGLLERARGLLGDSTDFYNQLIRLDRAESPGPPVTFGLGR